MSYVHIVARTLRGSASLCGPPAAALVWAALRRTFPDAVACVLMPEHLHLIVRARSPAHARRRLAAALGGLRRHRALADVAWEPVPLPAPIPEAQLPRQIRYVALNPCRRG